jgi:23S rRNA (pseudouridine1915-N3)-methyltransferase
VKFAIVAFGKAKFPFVEEGLAHYIEQIEHSAEIELILLKDQGSDAAREAEFLLESLAKRKFLDDGKTRVFLLDERGRQDDSRTFASSLRRLQDQGVHRFIFVIGGAFGFPATLREKFPLLSLSKLTFPHDLARLILAEQLYRALQIIQGGKYHHDG